MRPEALTPAEITSPPEENPTDLERIERLEEKVRELDAKLEQMQAGK
jgi:hypothetical protein